MKILTLRANSPKKVEVSFETFKQTDPPERRVIVDPLEGKRVILSRRSALRFTENAYNKSARGKGNGNRADGVIVGIRWNAYLMSGKVTPRVAPLEAMKFEVLNGRMRQLRVSNVVDTKEKRTKEERKEILRKNETVETCRNQEIIVPVTKHKRFMPIRVVKANDNLKNEAQVTQISSHTKFVDCFDKKNSTAIKPEHIEKIKLAEVVSFENFHSESRVILLPEVVMTLTYPKQAILDNLIVMDQILHVESANNSKMEKSGSVHIETTPHNVSSFIPIPILKTELFLFHCATHMAQENTYGISHENKLESSKLQSIRIEKGPGYISSPLKKVFQLRVAQGAAAEGK